MRGVNRKSKTPNSSYDANVGNSDIMGHGAAVVTVVRTPTWTCAVLKRPALRRQGNQYSILLSISIFQLKREGLYVIEWAQADLGMHLSLYRVTGLFLCKSCVTWAASSFSGHGIHLGLGRGLPFFTFDGVLPCSTGPVSRLFSHMMLSLFCYCCPCETRRGWEGRGAAGGNVLKKGDWYILITQLLLGAPVSKLLRF